MHSATVYQLVVDSMTDHNNKLCVAKEIECVFGGRTALKVRN